MEGSPYYKLLRKSWKCIQQTDAWKKVTRQCSKQTNFEMYCLLALISLGTILIDLICDSRHLFIYIKMSIKLVISKWGEKLKSATFKGFSHICNKSYQEP